MDLQEVEKVLEELHEVRPEKLNDKAKRLFEAIMKIADQRDKAEADLYEANNRINDLLDLDTQKDKLIDLMAEEFINKTLMYNDWQKNDLIEYFEERCNK